MKIDFANLQTQYQLYKEEIDSKINAVLHKSNYIMGEEVFELEKKLEQFNQTKYAISCSNGTDALLLAMMALDIKTDDEIITTAFSFISTAETIVFLKAKPVFVDIEPESFNINPDEIERAITKKTKAIMPVSLYGQPADLKKIYHIAKKYQLKVIVDGAQSFGASYKNEPEINYCDIYTTSFFPAKPFGCYGDGGAVFTNNKKYAEKIKMMRNHGQSKRYHHQYIGMGGRLDTLQAAVLLAKLPYYGEEIKKRNQIAKQYRSLIGGKFKTPEIKNDRTSVWAQYTICLKNRDKLQTKLKKEGITSAVHYPIALPFQKCFQYLNLKKGDFPVSEQLSKEVLSLPMNAFLSSKEVSYICNQLHKIC